jgi:hypothetical protein
MGFSFARGGAPVDVVKSSDVASRLSMLARVHHTATLVTFAEHGPTVVVVGGVGKSPGSPRSVDLFDVAAETWRRGPTLLGGRFRHHARVDGEGSLVVFGGEVWRGLELQTPVPYAERLSEDGSAWVAVVESPVAVERVEPPRVGPALCSLADGRILAIGGIHAEAFSGSVEAYDLPSREWQRIGELAHVRAHAAAVELPNGSVLVLGGHVHDGREDKLVAEVERLRV